MGEPMRGDTATTANFSFQSLLLKLRQWLLVACVGYLLAALYVGWRPLWQAIVDIGPWVTGLALLLSSGNWLLRFVRWQTVLRRLGHRIPHGFSLRVYIGGWVLGFVPGKLGELIRGVFLAPFGVTLETGVMLFFYDRFSDLLALLLLASWGIWQHADLLPQLGLFWAVVVCFLLAIRWQHLWSTLSQWTSRLSAPRFESVIQRCLALIPQLRQCTQIPMLIVGSGLGVMAYGLEALALYAMVSAVPGGEVTLAQVVFIYAASKVLGAASMMPAGVGATEFVIASLLMFYGLPEASAIACALLSRLANIWYAMLVALWVLPKVSPSSQTTP